MTESDSLGLYPLVLKEADHVGWCPHQEMQNRMNQELMTKKGLILAKMDTK